MKSQFFFIFLVAILPQALRAQFSHESTSLESILKGKDLYIEEENMFIHIYGKENLPVSFIFDRDVTLKILNAEGVKAISQFILPENLDPTIIYHAPPVKHLGTYYSGYKVENFEVLVTRGNKTFKPKTKYKVRSFESFNIDFLYEYDQHVYRIEDLSVGDEVKLKYRISIPFEENYTRFASFRIFFHSDIPKLKYTLNLQHHETLDIEIYDINNALQSVTTTDHIVSHRWGYRNLPGCLKEQGAHPYKELPHVNWVLNRYRYRVINENTIKDIPHYAIIDAMRSPDIVDILSSIAVGSNSPQFLPFTKTYEIITTGMTEDHRKFVDLHRIVTDEFSYVNDREYYNRNDFRGERLGEFFQNKVIRDLSRYNLYFAMLSKSDMLFYSAYTLDKRCGEISDEYFQPAFDSDHLLATYFGVNILDYTLPKYAKFGWYFNEIPFYWEGSVSRLVHISDYAAFRRPIKEVFRTSRISLSPADVNKRDYEINASVDLDFDSIYFESRLRFSGQYSTMCRARYLGGIRDHTVNAGYYHAVWEIPGINTFDFHLDNIHKEAPYETEILCKYRAGGQIEKTSGGYEIDLAGFFLHILPQLDSATRFLTYFPDFSGTDKIKCILRFPRPVKLEGDTNEISVNNEFGSYHFTAIQESTLEISLNSEYVVKAEQVPAVDYNKLVQVVAPAGQIKKLVLTIP